VLGRITLLESMDEYAMKAHPVMATPRKQSRLRVRVRGLGLGLGVQVVPEERIK